MTDKVLVTGADGFIGSHLCERLVSEGYQVRAMVQYNAFDRRGWLDRIDRSMREAMEIIAGDIRDYHGMRTVLTGCDAVLHLAALIAIPYSYHAPEAYVEVNVRGTLNVVAGGARSRLSPTSDTSTSEVYGRAQRGADHGRASALGQSPYAASKIGADQVALSFYRSFETPVAVVRAVQHLWPAAIGPRDHPDRHHPDRRRPAPVRLGALTPTRDFNYVDDTARGFAAAKRVEVGRRGDQSGSGYEISVGDIVALIAEVMGVEIEIETDPVRLRPGPSEVMRLRGANAKARDLLGWTPEFVGRDGLRQGLERTVAWLTAPENLDTYRIGAYVV